MELQGFGADVLCAFALKSGAKERLDELIKSGEVSASNIVTLLSPQALRDRQTLAKIIAWIGEQVRENGARIVAPLQEAKESRLVRATRVYREKSTLPRWKERDVTIEAAKDLEGRTYLQRLAQHTILTREEETALFKLVAEGDLNARNKLIRQNQRLVISIARRYLWSSLPLEDLVQEGNLGLMKAIDEFDSSKGFKLATYATWWIRQHIGRAIMDTGALIRVPVYLQEAYGKIIRAREQLHTILGREPTNAEIAARLKWKVEQVAEVLSDASFRYASLNETVGEEKSRSLQDTINDPAATDYAFFLIEAQEKQQEIESELKALLWYLQTTSRLPERTTAMFRKRYGLERASVFEQKTLETVGNTFNVSRERVRQIIEGAWEVLTPKFDLTEGQMLEWMSQLQELEKITGKRVQLGP